MYRHMHSYPHTKAEAAVVSAHANQHRVKGNTGLCSETVSGGKPGLWEVSTVFVAEVGLPVINVMHTRATTVVASRCSALVKMKWYWALFAGSRNWRTLDCHGVSRRPQ